MDIGKDLQRAFDDGYAKAIDEFAERIKVLRDKYTDDCFVHKMMAIDEVLEIAEEMRGTE